MTMRKSLGVFLGTLILTSPLAALAYPFGGQIKQIIFCYNNAIYAAVGPPNGGPFIWTPSTRTYQYGPPRYAGQWLLGLAAPPYYCLVSKSPLIPWVGILMTMEGSSGVGSSGEMGGGFGNSSGPGAVSDTGSTGSSSGGGSSAGISHLVISEVYPKADSAHGGAIEDEWIEIFNPTSTSTNLSHWTIRATSTSQTIPNGTTLPPGAYIILAGTQNVRALWLISSSTQVLAFSSPFRGFVSTGDHVFLQNASGTQIDSVSWGNDIGAFSPPAPLPVSGHSLIRKTLSTDTNSDGDWIDTAAPNPGR